MLQLTKQQEEHVSALLDVERGVYHDINHDTYSMLLTSTVGFFCGKIGSGKSLCILRACSIQKRIERSFGQEADPYLVVPSAMYKRINPYMTIETISSDSTSTTLDFTTIIVVSTNLVADQWVDEIHKTERHVSMCKISERGDLTSDRISRYHNGVFEYVIVVADMYKRFVSATNDSKRAMSTVRRLVLDNVETLHIPGKTELIRARFTWFVSSWKSMLLTRPNSLLSKFKAARTCVSTITNSVCFDVFMDHVVVDDSNHIPMQSMFEEITHVYSMDPDNITFQNGLATYVITNLSHKDDVVARGCFSKTIDVKRFLQIKGESECNICFHSDVSVQSCVTTCCSNRYCLVCIMRWLKNNHTCPLCKSFLSKETDIVLITDGERDAPGKGFPSKIDAFQNSLNSCRNRVAVWSSKELSDDMLNIGSSVGMVHDSMSWIDSYSVVHTFRSSNSIHRELLLLGPNSRIEGVNIQCITDIILLDVPTDMEKMVLIGIACRLGRDPSSPPLVVHKLMDLDISKKRGPACPP
jgi:hypothetical protein